MSGKALVLTRLSVEQQKLPPLPSIIRYLDDFSDTWKSIEAPSKIDEWVIQANGSETTFHFQRYHPSLRALIKHWLAWALSKLSPATVRIYFFSFQRLNDKECLDSIDTFLDSSPLDIKDFWHKYVLPNNEATTLSSLKSILTFFCEMSLGKLSPGYVGFVGAFRLPPVDKYHSVRSGNVFVNADEESAIVDYLDEINSIRLADAGFEDLRSACVLCLSYQYAMRPIQIAKVRLSDVKIYESSGGEPPLVHITFLRAKQRAANQRLPMTRKVKREWSFIFAKLYSIRKNGPSVHIEKGALPDSYFCLTPGSVAGMIPQTTERITGIKRPANHLRHSAAQRLVDAGASQIELAEFMGHAYADTGLVYFDASPAQADRINKALALSPIYSNVAEVARTRTIDKAKLLRVAPDQQIGGVPHGIPIAGIGSCDLGQSLCSKNPVLSCYSCRRFMAVTDIDIHKEVLQKLRPVVRFFYDESRGETNSPAYMQLRRTLESVQAVIAQIEGDAGHA